MAAREYFLRQATALLRLAKAVKDPALSAELITRAADQGEKALDAGDPHKPAIFPALLEQKER